METSPHQKWVNLSYFGIAALASFILLRMSQTFIAMYNIELRVREPLLIARGVSLVVGIIVFVILLKHEKANQFMNEVMVELSRVTWPTQKETTGATGVVIVMVLISGMLLGLLDYCWTMLLKWVI
jgi:preprotein translocase SecE subunit